MVCDVSRALEVPISGRAKHHQQLTRRSGCDVPRWRGSSCSVYYRRDGRILRRRAARPRTILRKEFSDFLAQDFIARRTEMDAIAPEKRLNRLAVLSEHVRADINIFCLWLCLQEIVRESVESQDVFEIHHPRRTRLHGDKCNRYRRRVASKNRE